MSQNKRKPSADRRPQGTVSNAAGKQRKAPVRNTIKTAQTGKFYGPAEKQQKRAQPSAKNNASAYKSYNEKSVNAPRKSQAKITPQKSRKIPQVTPGKAVTKPTAEEIARQMQKREAYKRRQFIYKKKLRDYRYRLFKEWLRIFFYRFILFILMFAFCFMISVVFFFVNLMNNGSPDTGVYTFQTGGIYDVKEIKTMKGSLIFRNGSYYINMTDIAAYCDFTTTGDVGQMRYISNNKNNDNVIFRTGDSVIYVNRVRVRLKAPVIAEDDDVYIPAEYFDKYVQGISLDINEKERKLTISRSFDEGTSLLVSDFETENLLKLAKGEEQTDIGDFSVNIGYGEISFTLHESEPTEHIDEYTIGRDLLLITDPEYAENLKKLAEQARNPAGANAQAGVIP